MPSVEKFFNILREVLVTYKFKPHRIFNVDESGGSLTPPVEVVCAVNAAGDYVPPYFIFGRKILKCELLLETPLGSDGSARKYGWKCTETFIKYLKHFAKHVNPSTENRVLILVDNHSSHISFAGINYCRERGIIMVGFPPKSMHRLQPLNIAFFECLKTYFDQECETHRINHPGQQIGDRHIGQIFGKAYQRAATTSNGIDDFRKCGIQPFDSCVFDKENDLVVTETAEKPPSTEQIESSEDPLFIPASKEDSVNTADIKMESPSSSTSEASISIKPTASFVRDVESPVTSPTSISHPAIGAAEALSTAITSAIEKIATMTDPKVPQELTNVNFSFGRTVALMIEQLPASEQSKMRHKIMNVFCY